MKKFLFLLLILGGAMYWGFSSGSELTKNVVHEPVRPHAVQKSLPKDAQPAEEKGILTEISDTVRTLISGLSSKETQEGSIEARPPKPDAKSPVAHRNDPAGGGTGNPVLGRMRDHRPFFVAQCSTNSPRRANMWSMGPEPLPRSSMADRQPEIYALARSTAASRG